MAAALLIAASSSDRLWVTKGSQEPYYWSVGQIHIAFLKLRGSLTTLANGQGVDPALLGVERDVLRSRIAVVSEPSEMHDGYMSIEDAPEDIAKLRALSARVAQLPDAPSVEQATELGRMLDEALPIVVDLGSITWVQDNLDREQMLRAVGQNLSYFAAATVLAIGLGLTGLLYGRNARTAARARLAAMRAQEDATRSKQIFLSMVSHELRSPLQALLSSVDLLQIADASSEDKDAMERIKRAAHLLNRQLRDLLTLARGEAGKMELQPEPFEVLDLVREVVVPHVAAAKIKGLAFALDLPSDPIFAVADSGRIDQVLSNLIANAVKYTKHGQVMVTLLPPDKDSGRLEFVIEDSGEGIPDALVPEIFKPFRRIADYKKADEGAGIGLAVVSVVLMHLGGEIKVDTKPDAGTRIRVSIPVLFEDEDAPVGITQAHQILIVDDRQEILDSLAALASRLSYACDIAHSAAEASNYLASKRYDAIFIDLEMPVKRGIELAWDVRRSTWPNKDGQLIAISAADSTEEGRSWPFNQFMPKPIGIQRLEAALGPQTSRQK